MQHGVSSPSIASQKSKESPQNTHSPHGSCVCSLLGKVFLVLLLSGPEHARVLYRSHNLEQEARRESKEREQCGQVNSLTQQSKGMRNSPVCSCTGPATLPPLSTPPLAPPGGAGGGI